MTRRPDRILDILDGITTDLDHIHDDLAWNHNLAWDTPAQARPDGTRGASLAHPDDPDDPDHVDAPKYDTGLGDHRSRQALRTAAPKLERAARHLAGALQAIQPDAELVIPAGNTTVEQLRTITRLCAHRTSQIRQHVAGLHRKPAGLDRAVIAAHSDIRSARGALARPLDTGPIRPDEPGPDLCRICEIRPRKGNLNGRCTTCHNWYYRHGKRERPTALDQAAVTAATNARNRRRARGEGWGAA